MKFIDLLKWEVRKYHYKYLYPKDKIFIHIPKTGGISYYKSKYNFSLGHFSIREFQQNTKLYNKNYFAIIRDPVERFISAVSHMKNNGSSKSKFKDTNLRNLLHRLQVDEIISYFEVNYSKLNDFDPIFREQSYYLTNYKPVKSLILYDFKNFQFKQKLNYSKSLKKIILNDKLKKKIYQLYDNDFKLYKNLKNKNFLEINLD